MVPERVVTAADDACAACRDRHVWAGDDARARAVCPRRVCELAEAGLPRGRDFRHVRELACDVDLWRPWIVAVVVGVSAHPAQAAWTVDEITTEVARMLRVEALTRTIAESERAKQDRAGRKRRR